ncbi:reverse transcriptase domain-containing protein [Tanacetum coccineum]|uniref:Reverse transcriptase domain-containing protein n=1 Tax=Tanacetum coccineum TaxID=301880 RepID=A0ABQ5BXC9_9ASTR
MILGSLKKFKKRSPEELKPRSKDTRRTSGNTTRNDPFPPFLIIEAQTQGNNIVLHDNTALHNNIVPHDNIVLHDNNVLHDNTVLHDNNVLHDNRNKLFMLKELPISPPDPITPPAILTPSSILPPSLLFDPRYFFIPEELLPPKKQICSPSSSSTTLSNPSRNQTHNLVSPSSSVYTPTPPQVFEIGKCSDKMYLKHHEKQVEDILNYLDELSLHRIEKMEEGRINGNKLKTELKGIRTQIIRLQKERMPPKRTLTSETLAITLAAIQQLINDGISLALKAQLH